MVLKSPQRSAFSSLREMLKANINLRNSIPFVTPQFAVTYKVHPYAFFQDVFRPHVPYRVDDLRFLLFRQGRAKCTINLLEHELTPVTIVFVNNGSVVQIEEVSPDTELSAVVISNEHLRLILGNRLPEMIEREQSCLLRPTEQQAAPLLQLIELLRTMVAHKDYSPSVVNSLLSAVVHSVAHLYNRREAQQPNAPSRAQQLFTDFLALVNQHSATHHTLGFYANSLCVTPRYLSTLVLQVSGATAKEWIDRSLITSAQISLKHTDTPVALLAETLHFPNAAFFSKFFKRLTGMTPSEYRRK